MPTIHDFSVYVRKSEEPYMINPYGYEHAEGLVSFALLITFKEYLRQVWQNSVEEGLNDYIDDWDRFWNNDVIFNRKIAIVSSDYHLMPFAALGKNGILFDITENNNPENVLFTGRWQIGTGTLFWINYFTTSDELKKILGEDLITHIVKRCHDYIENFNDYDYDENEEGVRRMARHYCDDVKIALLADEKGQLKLLP